MAGALRRIRDELGPDALILESRNTEVGRVEVLAAVPHPDAEFDPADLRDEVSSEPARDLASLSREELAALARRSFLRRDPAVGSAQTVRRPETGSAIRGLQKISPAPVEPRQEDSPRFATNSGTPRPAPARPEPASPPSRVSERELELRSRLTVLERLARSDHFSTLEASTRDLYLDLVEADLDATLALELVTRFQDLQGPRRDMGELRSLLWEQLSRLMQVGGAVTEASSSRVIALVGPSGVGKTTTLAKIAGHAAYTLGRRVSLVSIDNYRIFGADHLRAYAELMGIPFEAVTEPASLGPVLASLRKSSDVVLIDTSGRSPRDRAGIEDVRRLLGADPSLEIHLVLAANSRVRDLAWALDEFSVLPLRHLVFTKIDEARPSAGLFTVALKANRPVSYLGTGQEVPDDLIVPTPRGLLDGLRALLDAPGQDDIAEPALPRRATGSGLPAVSRANGRAARRTDHGGGAHV